LAALRRHGVATTLLAGDATAPGMELAARYGLPVDAYRVRERQMLSCLQWTPSPGFARWFGPRLARADLVHAHTWWAPGGRPREPCRLMCRWWQVSTTRCAGPRATTRRRPGPLAGASTCSSRMAGRRRMGGADRPGRRPAARGRSALVGLSAAPLPGLPSPRLTFTGRFRADKAPEVLVAALALLAAPPPAYLVGDGPTRQAVIRLVSARGLDRLVRLPAWSYEPARYVAGASVHVVPSRQEAWSQSAVVALGLGVPVVGTAVDGLAATRAISRVLAGQRPDPGPGRAYARQFTPQAVAAVYADAYRELLTRRAASGPAASNADPPAS
jgi:hypothetical protein